MGRDASGETVQWEETGVRRDANQAGEAESIRSSTANATHLILNNSLTV